MKKKKVILSLISTCCISLMSISPVFALASDFNWIMHTSTTLHQTDSNWDFQLGDYNKDGKLDIYSIKRNGTNSTEVHIMDRANSYGKFLLQIGTPLGQTNGNWTFKVGDYNNDGKLDLYCINKQALNTQRTEVHILDGASNFQKFLLHTSTVLGVTDSTWELELADYNQDGKLDIYCVSKKGTGSGKNEVHILDGASNFQKFLLQTTTALGVTDDTWTFEVGYFNSDGKPDIYGISKKGTGSGYNELHILDGANLQKFALQATTVLGQTGSNWDFAIDKNKCDVYGIAKSGTNSGTTEVHAFSYRASGINSGQKVVDEAKKYLGVPYVWGGTTPAGFDCSGFVQYVYKQALNYNLPRTTYEQVNVGVQVSTSQLQPGDLVFFGSPTAPHHVGIYIGNGQYIHSPETGDVVKISNLSSNSNFSIAKRVI